MLEAAKSLLLVLSALFPIVDPLGVFCWDLHSGVLRDFVAGGAGRWRVDRRRDGMDVAEAKGR